MPLTGTLQKSSSLKGKLKANKSIQAKSMTYIPSEKLSDLSDIDITNREDGSLIQWDTATQTFKVHGTIENNNTFIIGGTF